MTCKRKEKKNCVIQFRHENNCIFNYNGNLQNYSHLNQDIIKITQSYVRKVCILQSKGYARMNVVRQALKVEATNMFKLGGL